MIDPSDPKQARDYGLSGYMFIISVILLSSILLCLACYIYVNKCY